MKKWKCSVCGYIHPGDEPPAECPVCGAEQSKFILVENAPAEEAQTSNSEDTSIKWKCIVCGYIHTGTEPPDTCPVCGADKSKFVLVEENKNIETTAEDDTVSSGSDSHVATASSISNIAGRLKLLTHLHGHPITVHIPNGVLPLTVLFTLLAVLFKSESMAIAAKFNTFFVALSMPAVLFSGVVDWHNRFGGKMSPVFKVKIICGGIVTSLTFLIALWWMVSPDIYLAGNARLLIFCVLNIADLIVAAVAGFYGGKLVFNDR